MDNQKTAQMLKYGDILYRPTIEKIHEVKFDLIKQSEKGVSIKHAAYTSDSNWCTVHPCSTTISHESNRSDMDYINKSKAIAVQHQMRVTELKRLKLVARRSAAILDQFIEDYFEK